MWILRFDFSSLCMEKLWISGDWHGGCKKRRMKRYFQKFLIYDIMFFKKPEMLKNKHFRLFLFLVCF